MTILSFFTLNIPIRRLWTNFYNKEDHFLKIRPLLHYFSEIYVKICDFALFLKIFFAHSKKKHVHKLFSRIKLFEVDTCLNCLSLVNMIQYIKLVWKRRININFHKDQTNLQKLIKLKVDVENDSYFCKKLSGADLKWSKQIRNPWRKYEMLIFSKFWRLQPATLLPA